MSPKVKNILTPTFKNLCTAHDFIKYMGFTALLLADSDTVMMPLVHLP